MNTVRVMLHEDDTAGDIDRFAVLSRRLVAFVIDAAMIGFLTACGAFVVFVLGIVTFMLGWLLFPAVFPLVALAYTATTIGGPASATPGMRLTGLQMRMLDGERVHPLVAAMHALVFWFSVIILTPFILLFAFFNPRRRLLHDVLLGTIVIRRIGPDSGLE